MDLDLGSLVSDHFPHKLSGVGEATIQSAHFRCGRLEDGSATLVVGPGTIERSLVAATVERLGLVPTDAAADMGLLPYDRLALSATLDQAGLHLSGRCDTQGTVLSYRGTRLLGESAHPVVPVVALVQTLVPHVELQVPASRQTDWLLRHLPLPTATPLPAADAVRPMPGCISASRSGDKPGRICAAGDCPNLRGHRRAAMVGENGTVPFRRGTAMHLGRAKLEVGRGATRRPADAL